MAKLLFFIFICLFGCNPETKFDQDFLNENQVNNTPIPIDQIDNDNSAQGFGGGSHTGTDSSSGKLILTTNGNMSELDESWTPKWNNLIAYWKFEGNLDDSSSSSFSHPLNAMNGAILTTTEAKIQFSSSYTDGLNDYFSTSDHADFNFGSNDFSVQVWVYPNQNCVGWDNVWIINKWQQGGATPGSNEWNLGACGTSGNTNVFSFSIEEGTTTYNVVANHSFTINEWYHLVGVREGSKIKLYVNGLLNSELSVGTASINAIGNSILIGGSSNLSIFTQAYYDDTAIWNDSLSANEVLHIYNRQQSKFSGIFSSRSIDALQEVNWDSITSKTPLPFFKEQTGDIDNDNIPDNESIANYRDTSETLSNGLKALWSFNEDSWSGSSGEVKDSSGQAYHMTSSGGAKNSASFIGKALYINGLIGQNIAPAVSMDGANITNNFTYSFWAKPENSIDITTQKTSGTDGVGGESYVIYPQNGNVFGGSNHSGVGVSVGINGIGVFEHGAGYLPGLLFHPVNIQKWVHIVITYINKQPNLYINGKFIKAGLTSLKTDTHAIINNIGNTAYGKYKGYIDELSVWDRVLNSDEIIELYRRGANRLKYQVRTCNDQNCLGANWQGPDGTSNTYYSELQNRKLAGNYNSEGNVQTDPLAIYFPEFTALTNQRYFQYRVILESDDINNLCSASPCLPSIESIEMGPSR